jgi:hypothetical protein
VGSGIGSVDARSRPWASGDDPLYIVSCIRHLHLAITVPSASNDRGVVRPITS